MQTSNTNPTVLDGIWQAEGTSLIVRNVALVLVGTFLLYLSAKVRVPLFGVPYTMQTAVILMIGAVYGWKLGGATILAYLAEGAIGLPVFSGTPEKGIGIAYMMGPTGGYLLGFVAAAVLCGFVAERFGVKRFSVMLPAMLAGSALILGLGFVYLSFLIGAEKAMQFGVLPFILVDAAKAVLAAAVVSLAGWAIFRSKLGSGEGRSQ